MPALPIRLQDANFEERLMPCWSPLGGLSRRWVPFGMPRLNSNFERMVCFLYGQDWETGQLSGPEGTGTLIGFLDKPTGIVLHVYAVTCAHVIPKGHILRVTLADGTTQIVDVEPHEWQHADNGVDLAALDISDRLPAQGDLYC